MSDHGNALEISIEGEGFHRMLRAIKNSREFPGTLRLPGSGRKFRYRDMALGMTLMLVYVGFNVCGVMTTSLGTDKSALSAHPDCGIYVVNATSPHEALTLSRPVEFERQVESAAWAENCYSPSTKTDGCSYFLQQEIEFDSMDDKCPFQDMCYGGSQTAFTLFTQPVNGRAVGINAPKTYEFRRSTTCSPINMNETFVQMTSSKNGERTFRYNYGATWTYGDATWETTSCRDSLNVPASYTLE